MPFARLLALAIALLLPASAFAFDATKYTSPTFNTPNVDKVIIQGLGSTGDVSGMSVRATGGSALRTMAARAADTYNVLDNGLKGDCSTSDSAALSALLTRASAAVAAPARARIDFPMPPGGCYAFGSSVELPSNIALNPLGAVVLKAAGSTGQIIGVTGQTNVQIGSFIFDGQNTLTGHTQYTPTLFVRTSNNVSISDVSIVNPTNGIVIRDSYNINLQRPSVSGSLAQGVEITRTYDFSIADGRFYNNMFFGIIIQDNSYRGLVKGNTSCLNGDCKNGIELIGVTYSAYQIRIDNNHAEGTGDNGISVTGSECTLTGNVSIRNAHNGYGIYGSRNALIGNIAKNNGQRYSVDGSSWSGFHFDPGYGGAASYNAGSGNVAIDDQAAPTQAYGTRYGGPDYGIWTSGSSVNANTYVYYGANVYVSTTAGTAGTTPPTHTAGAVSDGGVTWKYLFTGTGSLAPVLGANNNSMAATAAFGSRLGNVIDQSNQNNTDTGSPEGVLRATATNLSPQSTMKAYGGALALRRNAQAPYLMAYGNYSSSTLSDQNWVPLMPRVSNVYTARYGGATGLNGAGFEGAQQFINDQNRVLYASGANAVGLVDALGRLEAPKTNLTAGAAGSCLQLSLAHSRVTTAASGSCITLPSSFPNAEMLIFNDGANAVNLYPFGSRAINSLGSGSPYSLAAGSAVRVINWDSSTYGVR